jgi:hypothetical protein
MERRVDLLSLEDAVFYRSKLRSSFTRFEFSQGNALLKVRFGAGWSF